MCKIDEKVFRHTLNELIGCILTEQDNGNYASRTKVTFDSGWLRDQEWYKREVWEKAQDILQYRTWHEENIQTYNLTERIAQCMDIEMESGKKHNLLDWRDTADDGRNSLKRLISEKKELSEAAIYEIFCGNDEKYAFENAIEVWGEKYPFLSFLFFLKDKQRFVPVRPDSMKKRFEKLGIESHCLRKCSWENYLIFLQIIQKVQNILKEQFDPSTELIDAHSFVWVMWLLDKTKADPLPLQFEKIEEEVIGADREAMVKVRINQSEFRKRLMQRYNRCCLCGVSSPELLNASHIKPWRVSNQSEKVDVDNGLLLCPNHDRLFDIGWITFSDEGKIIISDHLSQNDRIFTNIRDDMHIILTSGIREYMRYHRQYIFKGGTV